MGIRQPRNWDNQPRSQSIPIPGQSGSNFIDDDRSNNNALLICLKFKVNKNLWFYLLSPI